MRRLRALSAAELTFIFISCLLISDSISAKDTVDPCKRQPFRGRCPVNDGRQTRSQFVLRYYLRKGECVSYPYGYCSNDQDEPRLFRFKEECEESCLNPTETTTADEAVVSTVTDGNAVGLLDVGHEATTSGSSVNEEVEETTQKQETYGTNAPIRHGEYETPKTECQRQRERAGGLIKGGFVPECTPAGAFQPLQCEPDGDTCFCVNENGIEVANSRCQPGQPKPDCEKIIAAKPMRTNECTGGAESGPCQSSSQRWFYDEESAQCKPFAYSGCGGNGNNYGSEAACQRRCRPADDGAPKCGGGASPLAGANGAPVNCGATACPAGYKCNVIQETHHICCPDAEKSPDAGVLDSGVSPSTPAVPAASLQRCAQPKDRGPCDRYELRFYYNAETHECKYFFYGGCEGNENNFKQTDDCERACGRSSKPTTSTTVTETTVNVETNAAETTVTAEASTVPPQTEAAIVTQSETTVGELSPAPVTTASEAETEQQTIGAERSEEPSTTAGTTTTVAPTTTTRAQPRVPEPTLPPQATPRTRAPTTTEPLPPNSCQHPLDRGHCSGQFIRWHWNAASRICETFTYSGCGGNGNNFNSRGECLGRCHKEVVKPVTLESVDLVHVCDSDIDIGECGGTFMRYAFDRTAGECRQFKYGGCGGNGNNFATMDDCRLKCLHKKKGAAAAAATATAAAGASPQPLPKNICEHEIDIGECTGLFHRYAYDTKSNECRRFDYGGCGGNGNNFAAVEDCRTACVKVKCAPEPECDTRRCQLVRDAHGCPFCSCPPVPRHPPVNTRAPPTPAPVPAQPRAPCPAFDMDSCTEPCIVFRNRVNCNECVCPVIPTTNRPSADCAPFDARACASPCKTISNRAGCQECVCPVAPSILPDDDISMPDLPPLPAPIQRGRVAQPPAPAAPPAPAPPAVGAFAARINEPVDDLPPPAPIPFGELGEKCTQPLDPGPCTNFVQRWHFNPVRAECEPFQYGGCAGNRNHFFTQMECMVHCGRFLRNQGHGPQEVTEVPLTDILDARHLQQRQRIEVAPRAPAPTVPPPPPPTEAPIQRLETFTPPRITVAPPTLPPIVRPQPQQPQQPQAVFVPQTQSPQPQPAFVPQQPRQPQQPQPAFVPQQPPQPQQPQQPQQPRQPQQPQSVFVPEPQPAFVPQPTLPSNPPIIRPVVAVTAPSAVSVQPDTTVVLTTKMKEMDMGVQLETKIRAPDSIEPTTSTVAPTHRPTLRIQPIEPSTSTTVAETTAATEATTTTVAATNAPTSTSTTVAETTAATQATTTTVAATSTTPETQPTSPTSTSAPTTPSTKSTSTIGAHTVLAGTTAPVPPPTARQSAAPPAASPPPTAEPTTTRTVITTTTTVVSPEVRPPSMAGIETRMPAFRPFSETEPLPPARELRPLPQAPPASAAAPPPVPTIHVEARAFAQPNVAPETAAKALTPPPTPIPRKAQMEWLYPPGATIAPRQPAAAEASTVPRAAPTPPQPAVQPLAALPEAKAAEIAAQPPKKEEKLTVPTPDAKAYAPRPIAPPRIQIHQIGATSTTGAATTTIPVTVASAEPVKAPTTTVAQSAAVTVTVPVFANVEPEPEEKSDQGIEGPILRVQTVQPAEEVAGGTQATQPTSAAPAAPTLSPQPQPTAGVSAPTTSTSTVTVTTTTTTVAPEIDDTCILAPEPGPCTDYVPRWFFNAQTAKCEQFAYGSCNGNKNNFVEREHCERRCRAEIDQFTAHLPARCTRPRAEGEGVGYAPRWYYNQKNLRCEQFVYRGEAGNDNQFATNEDCERACKYFASSTDGSALTPVGEPTFVAPNFAPRPILKEGSAEDLTVPERRKPSGNAANSAESQSFGARNVAAGDSNGIDAPQPAEPIETEPKPKYPQESIADRPINPDANLPPLGSSMKAHIDYGAGKRLGSEENGPKAFGINTHTLHKEKETQAFGKDNDENDKTGPEERASSATPTFGDEWTVARIPVCPNGLNAMQYTDGRPVMCLPGKNQCPDKSVCFFNGLDYFCCPNEDDPYDKHVFGGYDGEEVKHGYKEVASPLSIHSIRRSRRAAVGGSALPPIAFSLDQVQNSLRFDDKPVQRIASASSLTSSRRVSPCLEEAQRGSCNEAHLRFFYDINVDRCRLFYYTGCGGNSNNFATEAECERRCKIGTILTSNRDHIVSPAAATPAPAASAPIVPPGQCPGGEAPLGDPSPVLCGTRTDSIGCPTGYYCRTGPPDVCCPTIAGDVDLDIGQLLNGQVERGDVRRKPFVAGAAAVGHDDEHKPQPIGNGKYGDDENGLSSGGPSPASNKNAALGVPANMCPDGSDALAEGGVARQCGTGFDGHELCPRGYYCSIDSENHARLCCPLSIHGSNIGSNLPTSGSIAPYFGTRGANPGEVIDRGSLPSDPKPPKLITPAPRLRPADMHPADYEDERSIPAAPAQRLNVGVESDNARSVAEVAPAVMPQANGSEYDHLIIKNKANRQAKVIEAHKPSADDRFDKELFSRGVGAVNDDPFETLWVRSRGVGGGDANAAARTATCRPRPSEGRVCQPGEPTPRSNLQFFYSEKERVCKVFFYRGCGGNANRFPTKRECEQYCANRA